MNCPIVSPAAYLSPTISGGGSGADELFARRRAHPQRTLETDQPARHPELTYTQQMASGAFLMVLVTIQIYLTRTRKP
jgi:hypothetical protein